MPRYQPACRRESCLVKDRRERIADISTARFVLSKGASLTARRFLMLKEGASATSAAAAQIIVVVNWLEELKRRVPRD